MRFKYFLSIFLLLFFFLVNSVLASSNLYFSAPPKNIEVGDRVTIFLRIKATEEVINAISGVLTYPENLLGLVNISKEQSIINLWTGEPKGSRGKISFEGVVLNPGFEGENGLILKIIFEAKQKGTAYLNFIEGFALANDGRGSNVLAKLGSTSLNINSRTLDSISNSIAGKTQDENLNKIAKLPVITDYTREILSKEKISLSGKGEPNTLTKIIFKDVSVRSLGEELLTRLQTKKKRLDSILVKNDENGNFHYISGDNLVAGVYNATPFLVDEEANVEKPGLGTQVLVSDSKIVKNLIVFINVLGLFIPIVALCVIIYFIPWYSWLRMRILKKKIGLEEEQIELSGINLARRENLLNKENNENKE